MSAAGRDLSPEIVAARVTGIGVGLAAFMLTWIVGSRVTELIWPPPVGPIAAMLGAMITGFAVGLMSGRRLVARVRSGDAEAGTPQR